MRRPAFRRSCSSASRQTTSTASLAVHKRVNVRVLELINEQSGSKIELEGNRVPVTHSKDVIEALKG